ncbi:hypothetical protein CLV84_0411 [Neolewinella xylanilytica]|uniref:Uncharacterized protein n=2 Tax=Neolewinella xylanilytica TaxID=1514080 RepID=A0A2S6I7J6_9BACT|nr:hypothetical protein CLV84_0411 [Neolewinella xylanilytica]
MTTEEQFAEQRRRNRTAYTIEDFYDARSGLRYAVFGNLLLSAIVAVSLLSSSEGLTHVGAALVTGAGVFLAGRYAPLERILLIYLLLAAYTAGVALEYGYAGLPAPPLPDLTVEKGWVGFVPFANSLFPMLYILARGAFIYPLVSLLFKRRALSAQPMSTLRQLDRDLAAKLE